MRKEYRNREDNPYIHDRRFEKLWLSLRSATLLVIYKFEMEYSWRSISTFFKALKRQAPNLQSVRLAFNNRAEIVTEHDLMTAKSPRSLLYEAVQHEYHRSEVLPDPPLLLAGLPIRQIGTGVQIQCAGGRSYSEVSHRLVQFGVYLYTTFEAPRHWWQREELCDWEATTYDEILLSTMPRERAEIYERSEHKMWDWREKRGEEIKSLVDSERLVCRTDTDEWM